MEGHCILFTDRFLSKCIALLHQRNIYAKLYLSPVHARCEFTIRSTGKVKRYLDWKKRARNAAAGHGLLLLEIDRLHKFADPRFDGVNGFNDPTHFSEWVGTTIMRELGLPIRPSVVTPNWKNP